LNPNQSVDTSAHRDHLSNVDKSGQRIWIYPKVIKGILYKYRSYLSWLYFVVFFSLPLITLYGRPFFLLNILERKFIIFGAAFWPQDFSILVLAMLTFMVFIILFTVIFGRVWCGWACPQTVFLEMMFRKVETLIEGNANEQRKLDAAPWTGAKARKKILKHGIFLILSFIISNTFLAYIIGKAALVKIITDPPSAHIGGLISILVFTGVFYFVFARFRELVCIIVCPYGRMQSVILDPNTVVVAYDYVRGEPRGMIKKNKPQQLGDCVDCNLCVQVCPTGIDIRNGTQMECINCTSCIDACNSVMAKTNRPQGLIRYDSLSGIKNGEPLKFTNRIKSYTAVLAILLSVVIYLIATRSEVETTVLRASGMTYQRDAYNNITNLYNFELVNKTFEPVPFEFRINHKGVSLRLVTPIDYVPADGIAKGAFFITADPKLLTDTRTKLQIDIVSKGIIIDHVKTSFMAPH
jgi:cytochrome c oxidase accessory protein FixG